MNYSCQKGFAGPLILIIIIAAFGAGLIGPVVYPQVRVQVEKLAKLKPTPAPERSQPVETKQASEAANVQINIADQGLKAQEAASTTETQEIDQDKSEPNQTGQKDEKEEGKIEGIEDEPPLDIPFKVLDFNKLFLSLSSVKPTSSPITNYIGKIKIPGFLSGPTPTSTPKPSPTPALPKTAIVVTLDKVKVHDDEDPALNGEVQIVTSVRTGFTEQKTGWPIKNWDETNSGDTLKIDRPIFVLPKDLVDEKLAIWITVVENDSLPKSAPKLIEKSLKISEGSSLLLADPTTFLASYALEKATDKFLDWLGGNEHIGTLAIVLNKSKNFGMGDTNVKSYTEKKKNATITYTVREVTIPEKPLRVDIKVKKIKIDESGDIWPNDGDLYVWAYVTDGFDGREPHGQITRIPKKGTHTKEDNSTWNIDTEIFSGTITSPILYYEIGVWDDDGDTSNDDQLEIATDTLYMNYHKAGEVIKSGKDGDDGVDASATIERETRFYAAD